MENPRTLNLIQWSLQGFALLVVYLSSYHQAASLFLAISVVLWTAVPDRVKAKTRTWYRTRFPPKVRFG